MGLPEMISYMLIEVQIKVEKVKNNTLIEVANNLVESSYTRLLICQQNTQFVRCAQELLTG